MLKLTMYGLAAALLALTACGGGSRGSQDKSTPAAPASADAALGDPDKHFLVAAAGANLVEADAGRIAADRAKDPEVRRFGQKMVEDHTKANQELTELAKKKGVTLPDRSAKKVGEHLTKLKAEDFDREFMGLMVCEHAKAVALFEIKSKGAKDAEIRAWAGKMLPALKDHLEMAKHLNDRLVGTAEGAR